MGVSRRLFFALWPDESVRARIAAATCSVCAGGKPVPQVNYHLTLAFPGDVSAELFACVAAAGDDLAAQTFSVILDRFGYFPSAHVVWLGPDSVPTELLQLQAQLAARLARCGVVLDARPFCPHVTLRRKVDEGTEGALDTAIFWQVTDFVLVESTQGEEGSRYQVLRRWPLFQNAP